MIYFFLLLFAGAVLTVLFWAAVVAAALFVLQALLFVLRAVWWILTRPIVWFIIRPIEFIFGSNGNTSTKRNGPVPDGKAQTPTPNIRSSNSPITMTEKVDQLAKIKALLESGAITREEFDRMKGEVLAHR